MKKKKKTVEVLGLIKFGVGKVPQFGKVPQLMKSGQWRLKIDGSSLTKLGPTRIGGTTETLMKSCCWHFRPIGNLEQVILMLLELKGSRRLKKIKKKAFSGSVLVEADWLNAIRWDQQGGEGDQEDLRVNGNFI